MADHGSHQVKTNPEGASAADPKTGTKSESMRAAGGPASQAEDASEGHDAATGSKTITKLAAILALVLAIENIWLATVALTKPNRIGEARAAVFLSSHYFPAAVRDPVSAMNEWGTSDFRELHVARGLDSYRNWYAPVQEIPARFVTVARAGDSADTFAVTIERVLKSGASYVQACGVRVSRR